MVNAIWDRLRGDGTLVGLLPGGIHNGQLVQEISRQNTPSAFDGNKELRPCALVQMENETPFGPHRESSALYVVIYFYQRFGHETIQAAQGRAYDLLHRRVLTPTDGRRNFEVRHANTLLGMNDQALNCALAIGRYVCYMGR
jgi:hypothetical protein